MLTPRNMQLIARMTPLRHLTIDSSLESTEDFHVVSALTNLTSLKYHDTLDLRLDQLSAVSPLTNLVHLHLCLFFPGGDGHEPHLAALTNLQSLTLTSYHRGRVTYPCSSRFLSGLALLTRLDLCEHFHQKARPHLHVLGSHTRLKHLNLKRTDLSDSVALDFLLGLHELTHLNLSRCNLTSDRLSKITHLTKLRTLYVDSLLAPTTALCGLHFISKLPALVDLSVARCFPLSDPLAATELFPKLTRLTALDISNNSQLTGSLQSGLSRLTRLVEITAGDSDYSEPSGFVSIAIAMGRMSSLTPFQIRVRHAARNYVVLRATRDPERESDMEYLSF